jgi:membrane protein insertase Oxa1/YidC/SpoIIIJ
MDVAHVIHDMTGWPYAGVIVCITTMARMALFPLMISSQRVDVTQEKVQTDLERFKKSNPSNKALGAKLKSLRRQYGYHPWQRLTLPLTSLALTAYMWFGLRWMGYYYPEELSTGGILWFVDLTKEDPLHFLPILSGTTCLLMFEVGVDFKGQVMTPRRKLIGRGFALIVMPFLAFSPASIHIFWTSNWLLSALQDVFISQPAVRDKLGIAKANERETPIVFIKDVIKDEVVTKQNEGDETTVETSVAYRKISKGSKNKKKKRR